jgi:hypothetical protein
MSIWQREAAKLKGAAAENSAAGEAIRRAFDAVAEQNLDEARIRAAAAAYTDTGIKAIQLAAAGGFPQYARDYIRIRDKRGNKQPLLLNRAQMYIHEMAEAQMARRGYVRLIVLKGRQMGASTYILGRGYYKVTRKTGQKAYILTHELDATHNLFGRVKAIHEDMDPRLRPKAGRSNREELTFPQLESEYGVGTARVGDTGRSLTVQFFHGSEVAFWQAAKDIVPGLLQTIGTERGTEVWLESTANGPANFFASSVQEARKGTTDFELVFCPWYWDPGYSTPERLIPDGFAQTLTLDDKEVMHAHGLSLGQMHWRSKKIAEFKMAEGGDEDAAKAKFCQEYPSTVEEAFQGDSEGSFIRAIKVVMARKAWSEYLAKNNGERPVGVGPKRMGIDPSYTGGDGFRLWCRQGRVAWRAGHWSKKRTQESIGRILEALVREQPDEVYIDIGNNGGPIFDILQSTEWGPRIIPVLFGEAADDPDRHQNKRCEMWYRMRQWLDEKPQPLLEDLDEIQADLTGVQKRRDETGTRTKLESKDDMIKRLGKGSSPDDGDALALTFAYPSGGPVKGGVQQLNPRRPSLWGGGLR